MPWRNKEALSIQVFHSLHQIKLTFPETRTLLMSHCHHHISSASRLNPPSFLEWIWKNFILWYFNQPRCLSLTKAGILSMFFIFFSGNDTKFYLHQTSRSHQWHFLLPHIPISSHQVLSDVTFSMLLESIFVLPSSSPSLDSSPSSTLIWANVIISKLLSLHLFCSLSKSVSVLYPEWFTWNVNTTLYVSQLQRIELIIRLSSGDIFITVSWKFLSGFTYLFLSFYSVSPDIGRCSNIVDICHWIYKNS